MTGNAGGDSVSQIANSLPSPIDGAVNHYFKMRKGESKLFAPPSLSRIPAATMPDASSTSKNFPPGCMFARFKIWPKESTRISLMRVWSLANQYSQTL